MLYGMLNLAGVMANVTSGVATARSQDSASSHPPPQTLPCQERQWKMEGHPRLQSS